MRHNETGCTLTTPDYNRKASTYAKRFVGQVVSGKPDPSTVRDRRIRNFPEGFSNRTRTDFEPNSKPTRRVLEQNRTTLEADSKSPRTTPHLRETLRWAGRSTPHKNIEFMPSKAVLKIYFKTMSGFDAFWTLIEYGAHHKPYFLSVGQDHGNTPTIRLAVNIGSHG